MHLAVHDWLAVATTDGASGDQKIYLAAPLTLAEIEDLFADQIETRDGVFWDSRARAVFAHRSRQLGALVLEEKPIANADPEAMIAAMARGCPRHGTCGPAMERSHAEPAGAHCLPPPSLSR